MRVGLHLFRPILLPLLAGKEPDLDAARVGFGDLLRHPLDRVWIDAVPELLIGECLTGELQENATWTIGHRVVTLPVR